MSAGDTPVAFDIFVLRGGGVWWLDGGVEWGLV